MHPQSAFLLCVFFAWLKAAAHKETYTQQNVVSCAFLFQTLLVTASNKRIHQNGAVESLYMSERLLIAYNMRVILQLMHVLTDTLGCRSGQQERIHAARLETGGAGRILQPVFVPHTACLRPLFL